MTSITYIATAPITSSRQDTEQTFVIDRLTEFSVPETQFDRSMAASMDGQSIKGTLISRYQTARIGITIPYDERAYLDEMINSLADYQIAEVDAEDVYYIAQKRLFVMTSTNFQREARGCTHLTGSFDIRFLD